MSRIVRHRVAAPLALLAVIALTPPTFAAGTVTLDVPPIAAAGSAKGFEFTSFQFRVYLVPIGDSETDYSANVLANDYENYTYLHAGGGGSGRGGGYRPPSYVRIAGASYGDTYTNVTRPPIRARCVLPFLRRRRRRSSARRLRVGLRRLLA